MSRMTSKWSWKRVSALALGWLSSPWKPTATALTIFVVLYLRPVLEAVANEFRDALLNPNSERDGWLQSFALFAHRSVFVEIFVLCEILIIGAIVVTLINFALFAWRRLRDATTRRHTGAITSQKSARTPRAATRMRTLRTPTNGKGAA